MTVAHGPISSKQSRSLLGSVGVSLTMLAAIGMILAALFMPVVQRSDEAQTGYTIRQHEQELADLNAQTYALQAQIARLGSSGRVKDEANRLGFVPALRGATSVSVGEPAPPQILIPRSYLPTPQPAAPAVEHHGLIWLVLHALSLR
jgi:hypothetical protein